MADMAFYFEVVLMTRPLYAEQTLYHHFVDVMDDC